MKRQYPEEEFLQDEILIVDDNPENLQVLGNILAEKNLSVSFATSGQEAIEAAEFEPPDMILLDISMPGMDGYEVCRKLKQSEKTIHIPVIFLTAKAGSEHVIKGFEAGAVDYVTKPFNSYELFSRVMTHLQLKRSQDIIRNQNQRLKEINATKNRFFSILAHDLKSPFSTLITVTDYYKKNAQLIDENEIRKFLDHIYEVSMNTYHLLENLLDWSRSQAGILEVQPVSFSLESVIKKNSYLISTRAKEKDINVLYECAEDILVYADPDMISTVIRNLLGNAVKFTPRGGKVRLTCRTENNRVIVSIEDNGTGINKQDVHKLFMIDHHLSKPGTENEKGSGLGLILCHEFVEKNKGEIFVESMKGKGSKFTFTIPASHKNVLDDA